MPLTFPTLKAMTFYNGKKVEHPKKGWKRLKKAVKGSKKLKKAEMILMILMMRYTQCVTAVILSFRSNSPSRHKVSFVE